MPPPRSCACIQRDASAHAAEAPQHLTPDCASGRRQSCPIAPEGAGPSSVYCKRVVDFNCDRPHSFGDATRLFPAYIIPAFSHKRENVPAHALSRQGASASWRDGTAIFPENDCPKKRHFTSPTRPSHIGKMGNIRISDATFQLA